MDGGCIGVDKMRQRIGRELGRLLFVILGQACGYPLANSLEFIWKRF